MAKKSKGVGHYTNSNPGLDKHDWTEREGERGATHDILKNVEKNQHDSGQGDGGKTGPIRYGVDKE
jgi:hypothetical protein